MSTLHASIDAIPEPVIADLLDSRRRCLLLDQLAATGGEAVVGDLAVAVRAAETGRAPEEVGAEERQELREELFECHLPKFTATGVIEYDSMLDTIRLVAPEFAFRATRKLDVAGCGVPDCPGLLQLTDV